MKEEAEYIRLLKLKVAGQKVQKELDEAWHKLMDFLQGALNEDCSLNERIRHSSF